MSLGTLAQLVDSGEMDAGWAQALTPVEDALTIVLARLRREREAGAPILPAPDAVLRAFRAPFADVRVLIVGQDPYPTPGHPIGLSFAVDRDVRPLPRSLANIYAELRDDLGIEPAEHGDLSAWTDQGVMLLNRVLTVAPGDAGSHRKRGWEYITEHAIRALAATAHPPVAILWGNDARALAPMLGETPRIESAHPSPLSARRGFFGSRPFSRCNAILTARGDAPIEWTIPA